MPVKRVEKIWGLYSTTLPLDAPPIQVRETRRAFYAGAGALLELIVKILDPGTEPTEKDLRVMTEIDQELKDHLRDLAAGRA